MEATAFCCGFFAEDRSSAKYHISVVENGSLSRCDSSLRLLEGDLDEIVSSCSTVAGLFRLTVACLDFALDRFVQMIPWDQVDIVDIAVITHKVILTSEDDLLVSRDLPQT